MTDNTACPISSACGFLTKACVKSCLAAMLSVLKYVLVAIAITAISALSIFGLVYLCSPPARRKLLWDGFQKFGHKMGVFNSRVILTIFYILIITPYAIVMNLFIDHLRVKTRQTWLARRTADLTIDDARKQF